ncbi:Frizzled-6 [Cricetulus griseus]|uniref:Frizzled-6 n=1 Tax=Cricetulus griseus TaxID=10029 RepID=G3I3N3_CRIGR|nr:Frizzled-6 [Cricetulus griseus]
MEMSPFLWLCLFLPPGRGHSLFTCEPITVPRCMKMAYNMTFFPNLMGHYDQSIAAVEMEANPGARPDLALFMIKYLMTLIVGISAVFWVGSKKTCTEWAGFFKRNRKRE